MMSWRAWRCSVVLIMTLAMLGMGGAAMAVEEMYPRTEPGTIEVKELPARRALATTGEGDFFAGRDGNFGKLFNYIKKNEVSMTAPVEVDSTTNTMRFFAGSDVAGKALTDQGPVAVETKTTMTVVSIGQRGGYTRERYDAGLKELRAWMAAHPEWVPLGPPYAVYWNSPFVPGFLKHSEIHVPVEQAAGTKKAGETEKTD